MSEEIYFLSFLIYMSICLLIMLDIHCIRMNELDILEQIKKKLNKK